MTDQQEDGKSQKAKIEAIWDCSDCVTVYPKRPLTEHVHGHVFEGTFVIGTNPNKRTPCAVKFPRETSQYEREISALKKLGPFDHVISLLHYGYHSDGFLNPPYIALERCHDLNLHELVMQRKEAIPIYDVAWGFRICKQIIFGLSFIHNALIVHKDLKPSNILMTLDLEHIKIADFGSCQWISSFASAMFCPDMFGTTGYRPPESYGNSYVSLKSDIFSLGAVFYFILSNGKSPFGEQPDMWDYNSKYGITNMCDLQVPNRRTMKHLISSMLLIKRAHRPPIRGVYCHPCWSGDDVDFDMSYHIEEVLEGRTEPPKKDPDLDNKEFLNAIGRVTISTREIAPIEMEKCIVICNNQNSSLQRFSTKDSTLKYLKKYNDDMKPSWFSSVAVGSDIYVFIHSKSVYRLQCKYEYPAWERMADMIEYHGNNPPAVALKDAIYIIGNSGIAVGRSRSVSKFLPSKNRWSRLPDKTLTTSRSAVVGCGDFIYSIGGSIDQSLNETEVVERLDVTKPGKWHQVAPLTPARRHTTGLACKGHVLVLGGRMQEHTDLTTVARYNPQTDQWTSMEPMLTSRWGANFRCHVIDDDIFAVAGDGVVHFGKTMEKYDGCTGKWSIVKVDSQNIEIWSSVSVNLRKL